MENAAKSYARATFLLGLVSGAVELTAVALFLFTGASRSLGLRLPGVWAYFLVFGAGFEALSLAFAWMGRGIEIRFGMNRQSLAGWWLDQLKGLALTACLGLGAVELMYWLMRSAGGTWWLWAWAAFAVFFVVMAQIGPVLLLPLFFKMRRMDDDEPLSRRLTATYAGLRARNPRLPRLHGIFEWKLGEKSAKANAALTGLGGTRRVIISDTLLESSPEDEIEAVFIHELGHHVHHDIWRGLGFQTAVSFLEFWAAGSVLAAVAPRLGMRVSDVASLPLLILVFAGLHLALLPVSNGFVRAMERRADDYSFETLGTAAPLIAGLERLAARNLAETDPPKWKEWLLYSHPSIATRIRRGREWSARSISSVS
ncbi:MAG TPA: M48 family metalloprotease [Terriglobales bacterium]|nr:M48 family metalloprotease [Terriglobales bacterium]